MLQPVLLNVALGSYRKLAGFLLLPLLSPGLSSFGFLLFLLDGQASKRSVFLCPVPSSLRRSPCCRLGSADFFVEVRVVECFHAHLSVVLCMSFTLIGPFDQQHFFFQNQWSSANHV